MKHFYEIVIIVDVLKVIELLQNEVAGIIQNVTAFMLFGCFPESFKCYAIVQILARMNFIAKIHAILVKCIKDRHRSLRKLLETILNETCRALWPGINCLPHECA